MRRFYRFSEHRGLKVLEIGFGQGTDLVQFAEGGAICYGVDITQKHFELATKNFKLRGLKADLILNDANNLPYEDDTFDVVYSFGVLHHTPDTNRCISEAFGVLKPGGELIISLYHSRSAFHIISVYLVNGILRRKIKSIGYDGLLSLIEEGADGVKIKPLVKLYSAATLKIMLNDFSSTSIFVRHLEKSHFSLFGKFIPSFIVKLLENKMGWYVIGRAIK